MLSRPTFPSGEAGLGELKLSEMLAGLGESRKKLGSARKALERLERRGAPVAAPLPGPIKERAQRKAAYESTAGEVTKWQSMVKVRPPPHHTSTIAGIDEIDG